MKALYTILFLLALLVSLVGTAAAAPLESGTAVLVGVEYVPSKGPVFTFSVNGKFSKSELKGKLSVQNGSNYGLYCTQVDEDTVTCNTSKEVSGVNVTFSWGGSTFWTYVPPAQYCYTVYDYNPDFVWQSYGTHCQVTPAQYGDEIPWYNPDWNDEYDAVYSPMGPYCSGIHEDAYYYPWCDYYFES